MSDIFVSVVPRQGDGYLAPATPVGPEAFSARSSEIAESIARVATAVRTDLEGKIDEPAGARHSLETIELKFSLDLEAEAGVIIARTKASAGFEVTLTWRRNT